MSLFSDTDKPEPRTGPVHNGILLKYPGTEPATQILHSETDTKNRKPTHPRKDVTMRHAAFAILRDAGAGPTQAAKVLGLHPSTGSAIEKKLNAYEIRRDKLLSKAVQTVEKFVQGKPVGQVTDPTTGQLDPKSGVHPKGSDVMRAVELVMDREQPKIQLSASVSATFDPIDLEAYK